MWGSEDAPHAARHHRRMRRWPYRTCAVRGQAVYGLTDLIGFISHAA